MYLLDPKFDNLACHCSKALGNIYRNDLRNLFYYPVFKFCNCKFLRLPNKCGIFYLPLILRDGIKKLLHTQSKSKTTDPLMENRRKNDTGVHLLDDFIKSIIFTLLLLFRTQQ